MCIDEVKETLEKSGYECQSDIGSGGYSHCYKIYSKKYDQFFVCKAISLQNEKIVSHRKSFENEIEALCNIIHPYVIRVYKTFSTTNFLYLILEYCHLGDMQSYVDKNGPFKDVHILCTYLSKMLDALAYLEEKGIAHKDIKPANIFIDESKRPKLADFGLSKNVDKNKLCTDYAGTLAFLAPEVITHTPYKPLKADVWSFGITVYFLATGKYPFNVNSKSDTIRSIMIGSFSIPNDVPKFIKDLILNILVMNPNDRPTFRILKETVDEELQKYECNLTDSPNLLTRKRRRGTTSESSTTSLPNFSSFSRSKVRIIQPFARPPLPRKTHK